MPQELVGDARRRGSGDCGRHEGTGDGRPLPADPLSPDFLQEARHSDQSSKQANKSLHHPAQKAEHPGQ